MTTTGSKMMPEKFQEKLEEKLQDVRDAGMKKMGKLADGVEEAVLQANRTARRVRYAAEDSLEESRYLVKKNPIAAVAIAGAAGLLLGVIAGVLLSGRKNDE
jgi:ElaB/YqjD/DUF883 family membrane-anchored ribosome-binding protein